MSTYNLSPSQALRFPLSTAMVLNQHRGDVRADGTSQHNPIVAAMVRARAQVRAYYTRYFEIVKG